jgi:hypothetical protein
MDHTKFLDFLNDVDFPHRYWSTIEVLSLTDGDVDTRNNRSQIKEGFYPGSTLRIPELLAFRNIA